MKKYRFLLTLLILSACAAQPNLGDSKIQIKSYVASGQYMRDVTQEMAAAEEYIVSRAHEVDKPAIVLDIDETTLSNRPQLEANDYSFFLQGPCKDLPKGPCGLKEWQKSEKAIAFPATLKLYEAALKNNIAVFFITGRNEALRRATEANLRRAGYHNWTKLILRPNGTTTKSASDYKAPERAKIEAQGYKIIASIGDQPSDLAGGYAGKTFLISNPFYRIP